jgi:acyl-CoA thioesterase FadM
MGHLTTSRYVEMFDVAAYHFLHLIKAPATNTEFGWADVRQEIDYCDEVRAGSLILIRSGLLKVGRTSLRTRHVMSDPDETRTHAVLEAVTIRFDLRARKAAALPEGFARDVGRFMIGGEG